MLRSLTGLCLFFFLLSIPLKGQLQLVDSLKQLLIFKNGEEQIPILNELAFIMRKTDARESLEWSHKAKALAKEHQFQEEVLKSQYISIEAYCQLGYHDSVITIGNLILPEIQQLNLKELEVKTHLEIGKSYWKLGDWKFSLDYANRAAKIAETLQNPVLLWHVYKSLGILYYDSLNEEASDQYVEKAYEQFNLTNDSTLLPEYYYNYAVDYQDGAEAEVSFLKAIQASKALNDNSNLAYGHHNLGVQLLLENRLDEAKKHLLQGMQAAEIAGDHFILTNLTSHYGNWLFEKGQLDSAIIYYYKAIDLAVWENLPEEKRSNYFRLADALEKKGKFKEALVYLKKGNEISQSLFNKTSSAQLSEAHARYQNEKQQLEIAQQRNTSNQIIFGGLAALLLITGIFQWYFYRQRQKKKEAEVALSIQQKEAERLRHLDLLKTNFFTNISHELRTPLTLILAPLENAIEKVKVVGVKKDLLLAQDNSKKLLNLVNEILDLAKLDSGKLEVRESEVSLRSLVRRIFYSYESIAHLRKLQLDFYCPFSDDLMVKLDVPKFEKILNNLLANAIKFSEQNGVVTFSIKLSPKNTESLHSLFQFEIRDTGNGIHPEDLPYIFDRFYQSVVSNNPLRGGSGIGLALAKELAELKGGKLEVESQVGKGSTFRLNLPLRILDNSIKTNDYDINQKEERIALQKEPTHLYNTFLINANKPSILIVEDNVQMSEYLYEVLSKNFSCTTANDGKEALEKLKTQSFDLITSDVMMPFMDGFVFRQRLNENPKWKHIPFIMLTARSLEADKLKGFQLGIDDYITKPFTVNELQARIHALLTNKLEREAALNESLAEGNLNSKHTESAEQRILLEAEKIVLSNLENLNYKVKDLAHDLGYSQRNLTRVLKKLTGLSPVLFVLEIKLQKARQLLESRQFLSVTEVRFEIGIESASYFTKKFTERFGRTPSSYLG